MSSTRVPNPGSQVADPGSQVHGPIDAKFEIPERDTLPAEQGMWKLDAPEGPAGARRGVRFPCPVLVTCGSHVPVLLTWMWVMTKHCWQVAAHIASVRVIAQAP